MAQRRIIIVGSDRRTLLALPDGAALECSPRGDLYWVRDPRGSISRVSAQRAAAIWRRYVDEDMGRQVRDFSMEEIVSPGFSVKDLRAGSLSAYGSHAESKEDLVDWRQSLLRKLGLDHADIGEAVKADPTKGGSHV